MAREKCPGSDAQVEHPKFTQYTELCPECKTYQFIYWVPASVEVTGSRARLEEHTRKSLRLSPSQVTALKSKIGPLLAPYRRDQGWSSVSLANYATEEILTILRDLGAEL